MTADDIVERAKSPDCAGARDEAFSRAIGQAAGVYLLRQEIKRLQAIIKGVEIALARDDDVAGAMRLILANKEDKP